jgi:MFS family permease
MANILTREQRQLESYQKQLAKPELKFYLLGLMGLIIGIHVLDTYITDIGSKIQSLYMEELLVLGRGMSQEEALRFMSLVQLVGIVFIAISPFYKALIDRIGRRPIFIINIFGMAAGTFICYVAHNIAFFVVGLITIFFFVIHDLQIIYVFETAPSKWRSTMYGITKFIGIFGTLAIPALRSIYITDTASHWRPLYLVPALGSFAFGIISLCFLRESKVFLNRKVENLSIPVEERKKDKSGKDVKVSGIGAAFKYIFTHKQLKWLSIAMACLMGASVAVVSYFEPFMKYGGMSDVQITQVLYIQPFVMAGLYLLCGVLADFIGRKGAMITFSSVCLFVAVGFVFLVWNGASPILIGIAFGMLISSYWNVSDIMGMIYAESTPTELRGSVMGVQAYIMLAGQISGLLIYNILLLFINLGTIRIVLASPCLIAAAVIIALKTKETKGVDLETIGKETENTEGV